MQKIITLSLSLLLLIACQSGSTVTSTPVQPTVPTTASPQVETPTPTEPTAAGETSSHFLLTTASPVSLLRDGWRDYHPTAFGAVLAPTDLLNIDDQARVLCVGDELEVKTVASGQNRVPCPFERGLLTYRGAEFSTRRMGATGVSDIPFILYPRSTLVLTDRPTFHWNDTGAGSYSVMLTRGEQDVWSEPKTATTNTLPYPADEIALEPGITYSFVVIDNDSEISSKQDNSVGTGFALATDEKKAKIEGDAAKITALADLTDAERDFALGVYYAGAPNAAVGFSPQGEAWLMLEPLQTSNPTPAVLLLYGDVLGRLSLPDLADEAYQSAMDVAANLGDLESQATANIRLWCSTDDEKYYQEAERLYRKLGDQEQREALPNDATEC